MSHMEEDQEEMFVEIEEEPPVEELEEHIQEDMISGTSWQDLFLDHWFLWVIVAVCTFYIYRKFITPAIEKILHERADRELEARLHKNPDLLRARQEAMQNARMRMQELHDAEAARKAEQRKAREEKKRQETLSKQTGIYLNVGHRLNDNADPRTGDGSTARSNRTDYNPLMGSSSGGYRPPRRGCPGGGCG